MRMRAGARRLCPMLLAALLLGGCAVSPENGRSMAVYDFGLPAARTGGEGEWPKIALEVVAPPWFDALNVDYRLAYDDPLKQREYAGSRWAGAPGVLLAGLSPTLPSDSLKQLGEDASGMALSMVVPDAHRAKLQLVRDYQGAMRALGYQDFTQGSLEAWIVDDTGFPKKGSHSVGVAHQY